MLFPLLLLLFSLVTHAQSPAAEKRARPQVIETSSGFEFKNLKLSKEDEAALSSMYTTKKSSYRVSRVKNNEVLDSYGKADVRKVSIISSGNGGAEPQQTNWVVKKTIDNRWVDEQCITYITVGFTPDQIDKIRRILSKYDPSVGQK